MSGIMQNKLHLMIYFGLLVKGKPWCKGRNYPGGDECCDSSDQEGAQCVEGQGDCDQDQDCAADHVCGRDNCREYFSDAHPEDDCCEKPGKNSSITKH